MTTHGNNLFPVPVKGGLRGVSETLYMDSAGSTQDFARSLAVSGASHGMLVLAGEQTLGRGRLGREWESLPGGLYMSVILRPKAAPADLSGLSLAVADAVSRTARGLYGLKTRVKPPNDVLAWEPARRKYLKLSGILIDSSTDGGLAHWVVAGIGVNLENRLSKTLPRATTVRRASGAAADRDEFLSEFFSIFWDAYSAWELKAASRLN